MCALVNGVLIAYVGVTPTATPGTMVIFNGLAVVTGETSTDPLR